ncbi:alpha-glutamyl/putrescinyl thymine pyrophosphorylase clade 3 protein [Rhizobium rhizogenes]|uniref:alpha-glutamyl/putrescinyl thymine pyrophosphorylase clade 3 protein n=1 Tax=Rhizobium rhizogenes TaxID=359 RepID=UPI001574C8D5|nr:hypothetical protein [Rhizobium rhizogenes]NTF64919.1 hypothetical protein [Rhizobium rhizogenes]NTG96267.1 hypothetical protein [Rhizobium rhizogenes]
MERAHYDRRTQLDAAITAYEQDHGKLAGLSTAVRKDAWLDQLISSLRRIEYMRKLTTTQIAPSRENPHDPLFDPIRAAARLGKLGRRDDAAWMAFIATHFGKHVTDGWKLAANVLGSFGAGPIWDVGAYDSGRAAFDAMLVQNRAALADANQSGRFSNHRQYQSKKPDIISSVFRTYYDWQFKEGGFAQLLQKTHQHVGQNPTVVFDELYRSLNGVYGFGRLGKFDLLTMLGKLDLAPIEAGSAYIVGATGPLFGAKLLFYNSTTYAASASQLSPRVDALDNYLQTGKQVIEDSLCNWQKSPDVYVYFRG